MTRGNPLTIGEPVYVVPGNATAPSAAYRTPRAVIRALREGLVTVELDDGTPLTTHEDNIARQPPRPREQASHGGRRPELRPGPWEEVPLW